MAAQKDSLETRLINRMYELEDQYRGILAQRAVNRTTMRALVTDGVLDPEQDAAILAIYPERQRNVAEGEGEGGE